MQNQKRSASNLATDSMLSKKSEYDFTKLSTFISDFQASEISGSLTEMHDMIIDMMAVMQNNKLFLHYKTGELSTKLYLLRALSEIISEYDENIIEYEIKEK